MMKIGLILRHACVHVVDRSPSNADMHAGEYESASMWPCSLNGPTRLGLFVAIVAACIMH